MITKEIQIKDYNYPLPEERIAKFPKAERDHSKLLVYNRGEVGEDVFYNLPRHLPEGALMVFNNTRVIQARLHFRKADSEGRPTGALIEIFLLEPYQPADYEQMFQTRGTCQWLCIIGNQKKWKEGALTRTLESGGVAYELTATRLGEVGTSQLVEFQWSTNVQRPTVNGQQSTSNGQRSTSNVQCSMFNVQCSMSFAEVIDAVGELPIPPYLNREAEESDKTTYQTVYSKIKGSVAAPTAGLHFTPQVLEALDRRGIEREELTLHVGAGTFRPVKSDTIGDHPMHTEYIAVRRHTLERLLAHDCRAIAVGTTSVRTLESLYYMGLKVLRNPDIAEEDLHVSQWEPYDIEHLTLNIEHSAAPADADNVQCSMFNVQCSLRALLDWMDRRQMTVLHSSTQIIIAPGYQYKVVRMLVTNFHQPQSTLLLLVSAFVGGDWRRIYDYALAHDFRFLSYGDSSLLIPPTCPLS